MIRIAEKISRENIDEIFDSLINITFDLEGSSKSEGMQYLWDDYGSKLYVLHKRLEEIIYPLYNYYKQEQDFRMSCEYLHNSAKGIDK